MWIYRHHSCSDVINLDEESGRWQPVADDDRPRVSALGMVHRDSYPICGSYTIEDKQRYCMYWADGKRFAFMLPNGKVVDICRKHPSGRIEILTSGIHCEIEPARNLDGRLHQGFNRVRLLDGQENSLFELTYNADRYLRLYSSDFTAASAVQDLSDWDFFYALKDAIQHFSEQAKTGRLELSFTANHEAWIEDRKVHQDDLIYCETGKACPRSGVWAAVDDLRATVTLRKGDLAPAARQGAVTTWVWSRER